MRTTSQRLAGLQHEGRQPRLASGADAKPGIKTRRQTEEAAVDRVKNGDSSSSRVDDGPTSLTEFGMIAEPFSMTLEKCIGDALINEGAQAPKPHLPPVEVRMLLLAAGGLLPAGTASTTMRTIFLPTPRLRSFCLAKMRTSQTNFKQVARPYWRKAIEKKSRQTLVFDPGGCTSRLHDCPFPEGRQALLCRGVSFGCCDGIRG